MEALDGVNGTQFQFTPAEVAEMEDILNRHNGSMPTREVHQVLTEKFSFVRKRIGCGQGEVQEMQVREWFERKRDAINTEDCEKPKVSSVLSSPTFQLEEQNVDPPISHAITSASTQPQLLSVLPSETPQVSTLPPTGSDTNILILTNPRSVGCREISSTAKRRRGIVNGTRVPNGTQIKIIDEVVGSKRGTQISGIERCIKKPSRPTGGSKFTTQSSTLKEELLKANEEVVATDSISSLEERLRVHRCIVEERIRRIDSHPQHPQEIDTRLSRIEENYTLIEENYTLIEETIKLIEETNTTLAEQIRMMIQLLQNNNRRPPSQ